MTTTRPQGAADEVRQLLHGVAGAFLFGAPFLYTMEVWWRGNTCSPPRMLAALVVAYVALVGTNRVAGFRSERCTTWGRSLGDSAEALAIGVVAATLSLLLLRLVDRDTGVAAVLGRVVMEAVPMSFGVGLTNLLFYRARKNAERLADADDDENEDEGDEGEDEDSDASDGGPKSAWRVTAYDAASAALGSLVIAFSIAPTDEIPMLASKFSYPWLLVVAAASLALSYVIVFEAELGPQRERREHPGPFQSPVSETALAYVISLLMSAGMLYLFQTLNAGDPLGQWVAYTITLGLPATIGGAAGRLAL